MCRYRNKTVVNIVKMESDLRAVISEVARKHGYESLKEEQLTAIEKFVAEQDVFVSLPTGFRKSLIYGLLPAVFDHLRGTQHPRQ